MSMFYCAGLVVYAVDCFDMTCVFLCMYLFLFVFVLFFFFFFFFFSSRRRHTRCLSDWSSDVCSSDLPWLPEVEAIIRGERYYMANPDALPPPVRHTPGGNFAAEQMLSVRLRGEGLYQLGRRFDDYDADADRKSVV